MLTAEQAIVDEVEAAIRAGSAEKCIATAKRVTDLFLTSAGSFNSEQVELFDNVLERLVKTIELRALADISARMALAEISEQLAPVTQAPPAIIRRLAGNDEIRIARPVLQESSRLSADDLIEIAQTKSEQHLLAVAGRWWLKEVVTDALLARRFASVSHRLVNNPGAKVSPDGFAVILAQAEHDPVLAVETGIRADLPSELRLQLLRRATEEVRSRLLERAPPYLFEEIRHAIAAVAAGVERDMSQVRDFTAARRHIARLKDNGDLNEAALLGFARQRRYEETVVALAGLAQSSIEVIRSLMQSLRSEGLLVPCRAAGLSWETTVAVMECRYTTGSMGPVE
ncbi:MAG: DUF2336 domain-containing protein, partial [Bradyrhizobium sp.]